MPDLASSFWISVTYGVEEQAKAAGVEVVKVNAGGDANASQQIAQIQDLIQKKVDAIVIGATNGDAVKAVVEQAAAAGIPVIGISSPPNTRQARGGRQRRPLRHGQASGRVPGDGDGRQGQRGDDGRPEPARPGRICAPTASATPSPRSRRTSRSSPSRASPTIATPRSPPPRTGSSASPTSPASTAATDDMAAGVITALKSADKLDAVKVSASNLSPTAQQLIKDGELACTSIQQIVAQGRAAVDQAIAAADGDDRREVRGHAGAARHADNIDTVDLSSVVAPADYRP